jgi:hypothetical protein
MRDRHFPRLCRSCQAPMARQEDERWRCGAQWAMEGARSPSPWSRARAVPTHVASGFPLAAVADSTEARIAADSWADDCGSFDPRRNDRPTAALERRSATGSPRR